MLLIGGRQRLNSLGGQHTNMKITFGLWLDGCPPTSQAALAEKKVGPAGLLHWLEARLGLMRRWPTANVSAAERELDKPVNAVQALTPEVVQLVEAGTKRRPSSKPPTRCGGAVFLAAARSQASNPKPGMTHPPRTLGGTLSSSRVDKSDCPPRQPRQPHPARRSDTCFWHPFKK